MPKYEITLTQFRSRTVHVYADDPATAVVSAEGSHEGFAAESVAPVVEGETGEELLVRGRCEACGKPIVHHPDDILLLGDEEGPVFHTACVPVDDEPQVELDPLHDPGPPSE